MDHEAAARGLTRMLVNMLMAGPVECHKIRSRVFSSSRAQLAVVCVEGEERFAAPVT
nr:hypothetical protein [Changpingibacter yushuensis]